MELLAPSFVQNCKFQLQIFILPNLFINKCYECSVKFYPAYFKTIFSWNSILQLIHLLLMIFINKNENGEYWFFGLLVVLTKSVFKRMINWIIISRCDNNMEMNQAETRSSIKSTVLRNIPFIFIEFHYPGSVSVTLFPFESFFLHFILFQQFIHS